MKQERDNEVFIFSDLLSVTSASLDDTSRLENTGHLSLDPTSPENILTWDLFTIIFFKVFFILSDQGWKKFLILRIVRIQNLCKEEKWRCERIKTYYYDLYMTLFFKCRVPRNFALSPWRYPLFFVLFLQKYIFLGY